MRVLRVGKITYAALQVVLRHHLAGEHEAVVLWGMAAADRDRVAKRAQDFIQERSLDPSRFAVVDSMATFGGGSTPGEDIPSAAIRITSDKTPDEVARWFQNEEPPVVGTVKEGAFQIDFRTVLPEDEDPLAEAFKRFSKSD